MNLAAIMPMMTGMGLPAVPETVMMTMTLTMPNAAVRKDIPKLPAPKDRKVLTSVPMTALISKNVSLPVPQIMSPAKSRITGLVRLVTANMPLVNALPAAQVMTAPPFPTVMFRTAKLA